ncbi:hypothetical protein [Streptomyces capparidis]
MSSCGTGNPGENDRGHELLSAAASGRGRGDVWGREVGEVGAGVLNGFGVRLAFGVFGEHPVDAVPRERVEPGVEFLPSVEQRA